MIPSVSLYRIESLFNIGSIGLDVEMYDKIFINLSSLLNSMYYPEMIEELSDPNEYNDFKDKIKTIFNTKFIELYRVEKIYYFYVHTKPSFIKTYYPEWDKTLNQCKFESPKFKDITNFIIGQVHALAQKMNNIKFINTGEVESAYFPAYYARFNDTKKSLIISRDEMDFLNLKHSFHIFDGINIIKSGTEHYSKKLPKIHHTYIPYVIYLKGIKKHDYGGVKGYGMKSAVRYISKNLKTLKDDLLFKVKGFTPFDLNTIYQKHKELFDKTFESAL